MYHSNTLLTTILATLAASTYALPQGGPLLTSEVEVCNGEAFDRCTKLNRFQIVKDKPLPAEVGSINSINTIDLEPALAGDVEGLCIFKAINGARLCLNNGQRCDGNCLSENGMRGDGGNSIIEVFCTVGGGCSNEDTNPFGESVAPAADGFGVGA